MSGRAEDMSMQAVRQKVTELWRGFLFLEQIGPNDNFFELGGDSLSGITFMEIVEEEFGVSMDPIELFEHPVLGQFIERLAAAIAEKEGSRAA